MKKIKFLLSIAGFLLLVLTASAQSKSGFQVLKKYPVKGDGGWDYLTVDAAGKRLYVSHGNQVNILDVANGDSIGIISNTPGVHGIALVEFLGKGYTSNGKSNTCSVFDVKTNRIVESIAVGTNPDAIFYDEFSRKIYVFNGRSQNASVINPATDKVVANIALGAKPETGVSDGRGHIYVNAETTNEVLVINSGTYKVEKRFKIESGEEPSGLAIDAKTNRLFIGCGGNQTFVVMNAATGKNLAKLPIGDCDGVVFDPALKQAYASNANGFMSVIKEVTADKFVLLPQVKTEAGARTIAIDLISHHLFLPTATTTAVEATSDNPKAWPKVVPGTFHVLMVGNNQ